MTSPSSTTLVERVAEFVYRCGRVVAVPLATNHEYLQMTHTQVIQRPADGGPIEVLRMVPPELELDALAARSRPLFLESDRCGFKQGLSALRRLVRDSAAPSAVQYLEAIDDLREGWRRVRDESSSRYEVLQQDAAEGSPVQSWQQTDLAKAWQYGDLVHADHAHADVSDRMTRMIAGWEVQAQICALAHTSIAFIRGFDEELGLGIPSSAYEAADLPSGLVPVAVAGSSIGTWTMEIGQEGSDLTDLIRDALPDPRETFELPPGAEALELAPGQQVRMDALDPTQDATVNRWTSLLKGGPSTQPPRPGRARVGVTPVAPPHPRGLATSLVANERLTQLTVRGTVRLAMAIDNNSSDGGCRRLPSFIPVRRLSRVQRG